MIRMRSLQVEGFRGIAQGELKDLADVNLLVGRNNSGKSTVAEAASYVLDGGFERNALGNLWGVWRAARGGVGPEIEYSIVAQMEFPELAPVGALSSQATIACHNGSMKWAAIPGPELPHLLQFAHESQVFLPVHKSLASIEKNLWKELIATRKDKGLMVALKEIYGIEVEQIQLLPDGKLMLLFSDAAIPLDGQGDGTRAALRCLMLMASVRQTFFVIEEPESHQHPGSLERFAQAVCKKARTDEIQLLLTTHSSEAVRAFVKASQEAGSSCAVFHLQLENGVLDARRLEADTVTGLLDSGVDVRFLDLYA